MTLTDVGLEWTDQRGRERRMPFACMRWICVSGDGHKMRISGPPGMVWLSGADMGLQSKIIAEAAKAGCGVRLRKNSGPHLPGLGWLWARTGQPVSDNHPD